MRYIGKLPGFRGLLRGRVRVFVLPLWARKTIGYCLPPYFSRSRFRSVYVATYGRSGSTLLTRWLSTLPGFNIKGENSLFMIPACECEAQLRSAMLHKSPGKSRWIGDHPTNPWNGVDGLSLKQWRRDISNAILNQLYPRELIPHTTGFKEIRWIHVDEDRRSQQMDWIRSLRPPGAVIFLFRDLGDVMKSGWWQSVPPERTDEVIQSLRGFEAWASEYCVANPDHAAVINYRDFTVSPVAAARLCDFLGARFCEREWARIMGEPLTHLK